MKNLAIIPARGGSKRIPRKNIRSFAGKPIIGYPIQAALGAGLFDEVIVSTDDQEIAFVAQELGASVPFFRSAESSSDYATTMDVIKEVFAKIGGLGQQFDNVFCIYPTAVFATKDSIRSSYESFQSSGCDSLVVVTEFDFPVMRAYEIIDGKAMFKWPQYANMRSQDCPKLFHDAGQFYWLKGPVISASASMTTTNTLSWFQSPKFCQDIDTPEDWEIAEMKFKLFETSLRASNSHV